MIFKHCEVARLGGDDLLADPDLARHDPALESVVNVNSPGDYAEVLSPGLAPEIVAFGRCVHTPPPSALPRLGSPSAAPPRVMINGAQVTWDDRLPLVAGDVVSSWCSDRGRPWLSDVEPRLPAYAATSGVCARASVLMAT